MKLARAIRNSALALATLLALFAASAMAAKAPVLKPFTAVYDVNYMGLGGTGTMTLASAGGDRWRYSLDINSTIATVKQSTTFEANGGRWRPLSNSDSANLLIRRNNKQATYDWNTHEARWTGDVKADRAGPVELRDGDLDAMLLNLVIPRDLATGSALDYRMVDNGRVRQMNYEVAGKDTVQVDGATKPATRISRTDGNKQQVLWVVDGMPVPARILQRRDGKNEMDLTLKSIR